MPRKKIDDTALDVSPPSNGETLYSVFEDLCPTRLVLDRLADKWAVLILDRLQNGPMRFNSLKRDIKRITQKVLTQTLRKLERDGLIARQVFATVPVTVEYSLTPLGETLNEFISGLAHWAEHNIQAVLAAQAAFDAAAAPSTPANVTVHRL